MIYQSGNTIKLTAVFTDSAGGSVEPVAPKIKFYDSGYTQIGEYTPTRIGVGIYEYYLTLPDVETLSTFIYEWSTSSDGDPVLKRKAIKVNFV